MTSNRARPPEAWLRDHPVAEQFLAHPDIEWYWVDRNDWGYGGWVPENFWAAGPEPRWSNDFGVAVDFGAGIGVEWWTGPERDRESGSAILPPMTDDEPETWFAEHTPITENRESKDEHFDSIWERFEDAPKRPRGTSILRFLDRFERTAFNAPKDTLPSRVGCSVMSVNHTLSGRWAATSRSTR